MEKGSLKAKESSCRLNKSKKKKVKKINGKLRKAETAQKTEQNKTWK